MQVPLSRIEREYILTTLKETLPAFSVLSGSRIALIPEGSYACAGDRLSFRDAIPLASAEKTPEKARFFFFHKKRGMYFDLPFASVAHDTAEIGIPDEIYFEEARETGTTLESIEITIGRNRYSPEPSRDFPLDRIMINPAIYRTKENALVKLAHKSGIGDDRTPAVYRLFEYLDFFSRTDNAHHESERNGTCFFADNSYVLASCAFQPLPTELDGQIPQISIAIDFGYRKIVTSATLTGVIPVKGGFSVISFDISRAMEEDKRFLYERLYRQKYR